MVRRWRLQSRCQAGLLHTQIAQLDAPAPAAARQPAKQISLLISRVTANRAFNARDDLALDMDLRQTATAFR